MKSLIVTRIHSKYILNKFLCYYCNVTEIIIHRNWLSMLIYFVVVSFNIAYNCNILNKNMLYKYCSFDYALTLSLLNCDFFYFFTIQNKKLRFELQKSINVPINAISSVSGAHVRDKISRLLSILNAKTPSKDMSNETIIYNFCSNLVAKKFVVSYFLFIFILKILFFPQFYLHFNYLTYFCNY